MGKELMEVFKTPKIHVVAGVDHRKNETFWGWIRGQYVDHLRHTRHSETDLCFMLRNGDPFNPLTRIIKGCDAYVMLYPESGNHPLRAYSAIEAIVQRHKELTSSFVVVTNCPYTLRASQVCGYTENVEHWWVKEVDVLNATDDTDGLFQELARAFRLLEEIGHKNGRSIYA